MRILRRPLSLAARQAVWGYHHCPNGAGHVDILLPAFVRILFYWFHQMGCAHTAPMGGIG